MVKKVDVNVLKEKICITKNSQPESLRKDVMYENAMRESCLNTRSMKKAS